MSGMQDYPSTILNQLVIEFCEQRRGVTPDVAEFYLMASKMQLLSALQSFDKSQGRCDAGKELASLLVSAKLDKEEFVKRQTAWLSQCTELLFEKAGKSSHGEGGGIDNRNLALDNDNRIVEFDVVPVPSTLSEPVFSIRKPANTSVGSVNQWLRTKLNDEIFSCMMTDNRFFKIPETITLGNIFYGFKKSGIYYCRKIQTSATTHFVGDPVNSNSSGSNNPPLDTQRENSSSVGRNDGAAGEVGCGSGNSPPTQGQNSSSFARNDGAVGAAGCGPINNKKRKIQTSEPTHFVGDPVNSNSSGSNNPPLDTQRENSSSFARNDGAVGAVGCGIGNNSPTLHGGKSSSFGSNVIQNTGSESNISPISITLDSPNNISESLGDELADISPNTLARNLETWGNDYEMSNAKDK